MQCYLLPTPYSMRMRIWEVRFASAGWRYARGNEGNPDVANDMALLAGMIAEFDARVAELYGRAACDGGLYSVAADADPTLELQALVHAAAELRGKIDHSLSSAAATLDLSALRL
jgi:NAD(P)-dependent dehydrogenase (short-subunit alcohol dehydrogenase family)